MKGIMDFLGALFIVLLIVAVCLICVAVVWAFLLIILPCYTLVCIFSILRTGKPAKLNIGIGSDN